MDARSPQRPQGDTAAIRRGADHIAPDCAGQNFYAIDRALRDLLPLYLYGEYCIRPRAHAFDRKRSRFVCVQFAPPRINLGDLR